MNAGHRRRTSAWAWFKYGLIGALGALIGCFYVVDKENVRTIIWSVVAAMSGGGVVTGWQAVRNPGPPAQQEGAGYTAADQTQNHRLDAVEKAQLLLYDRDDRIKDKLDRHLETRKAHMAE